MINHYCSARERIKNQSTMGGRDWEKKEGRRTGRNDTSVHNEDKKEEKKTSLETHL